MHPNHEALDNPVQVVVPQRSVTRGSADWRLKDYEDWTMGGRAICAGILSLGVVEEAERSAERLDHADRLDCGSSRVVELPLRSAFF